MARRPTPRRDRSGRFSSRGQFTTRRGKLVRIRPYKRITYRPDRKTVRKNLRRELGIRNANRIERKIGDVTWLGETPTSAFLAIPSGDQFPLDLRVYWLRTFYDYEPYEGTRIPWTRLWSSVDVIGTFGKRRVRTNADFLRLAAVIRESFIDETVGTPPVFAQLLRREDLRNV